LLVTISGLPGSGTSTVARLVAPELGLAHVDGGTIFRQLAADAGRSLADFSRYAERHREIDIELDRRLADRAHRGDVVLESRLAGWIATNEGLTAVRVWIACPDDVRAGRVALRDGVDIADSAAANRARERSERDRYGRYYGIDLDDLSIYDLVLDSGGAAPEELAGEIVAAARRPGS
jgi:CMP/dCMP kinase